MEIELGKDGYPLFTPEMKKTHTILIPMMLPIHFEILVSVFGQYGYKCEVMKNESRNVVDEGLKNVHNDTCYPALLCIGQFMDALKSGKYDVNKVALMLPQTAMGAVWKDEASAADETAMEVISEEASEEASEEEGDGAFAGEQTVVDNDACKIVVTGLDPEGLWGYDVDVYLENKSEDVKYTYTLEYAAVNGLEMMTFMSEEVAAGKKANSNFTLDTDDLEEAGLTVDDVTDITLNFRVYDSDDWSADDAANETVHIYPNGKSEAVKYEREPQDTDIVLMDDDPGKISKAIKIAKKCMRIAYENIYFAIGVKIACLLLGAVGLANMWLAIFADVGVMVIAVLNAIRALFVKNL